VLVSQVTLRVSDEMLSAAQRVIFANRDNVPSFYSLLGGAETHVKAVPGRPAMEGIVDAAC